jgi:hypothetical protein
MVHIRFAASLVLLTICVGGRAASDTPPPRINCEAPHQIALDLAPIDSGPLTLAGIYCHALQSPELPIAAPAVSPDGRSIAFYEHNTSLRVARLDGGKVWTDYPADLGIFARLGSEIRSVPAFSWAADSRFLWAATHERERPSGFAKTPMRPVRTTENGGIEPLPQLQHDAGPLDALLWAGGDGLAVAEFGARGGFHRPEHDDRAPAFAIVDARRGLVLDTLPFDAVEPLRARTRGAAAYALVKNAAAATLPDGRVRVLLSVGQWIVWTQGEAPRVLADPYAGESHSRMILSPDGSRVLVGRMLRTEGGICHRVGGCTSGHPVKGVLAALHDLATGRTIWTLRATAIADQEFPSPAISQDGRYAMVGLMAGDVRPRIALISMDDGQIVQTLPAPGGAYAMGFVSGGRTVWTHAYGLTALYDVAAGVK